MLRRLVRLGMRMQTSCGVQRRGPSAVPSPTRQPSSRMRRTSDAVSRASSRHITAAVSSTGPPKTPTLPSISGAWATSGTYSACTPAAPVISPPSPPKTAFTASMMRRPERKFTASRTRALGSASTRARSTAA